MNEIYFVGRGGDITLIGNEITLKGVSGASPFAQLIVEAARANLPTDVRVFVTWWSHAAPLVCETENDVLFVLGDEGGIVKAFADRFALIVKFGPLVPEPLIPACSRFDPIRIILRALRVLRYTLLRRQLGTCVTLPDNPKVIQAPLGFASNATGLSSEQTVKPIAERTIDISFAGGLGPQLPFLGGRRVMPLSPKALARIQAVNAVENLARQRLDLAVRVYCFDRSPKPDVALPPNDFADLMRETKISICPRGNFLETYRHYESAAAGCIIVTDGHDDSWFASQAPFVVVPNWSDAPREIERLLADRAHLEQISRNTLHWWHHVVAPRAVGSEIGRAIRHLRGDLAAGHPH